MSVFPIGKACSTLHSHWRERWALLTRDQRGFTLVELLVVISMLAITMAMFSVTYSTTVDRSSQVQAQNIAQTEVRASLNQMVSDLRDATTGGTMAPIISYGDSSISFYSPDRMNPTNLRKITYSLTSNNILQRQSTPVTSYDGNGNPIDPGNTGTVQNVATVLAPATGDPTQGGWKSGQIFKYCVQSPPNMTIDPNNATSPELITWSCQTPASASEIKTVVMRAVVSPVSRAEKFNYGAVATLRWNAS
jgi:prepilin-type N-terminal cleavage/methylation domain-containing protein